MITHEIKPYSTALCTEVGRLRERYGALVANRVWTAAVEKNKLDGRRISVSTLRYASGEDVGEKGRERASKGGKGGLGRLGRTCVPALFSCPLALSRQD